MVLKIRDSFGIRLHPMVQIHGRHSFITPDPWMAYHVRNFPVFFDLTNLLNIKGM